MLPETEIIIDSYTVHREKSPGKLFLSSSWVLFDTLFSGGPDNDNQVAIELIDIKTIKRSGHVVYETIEIIQLKGEKDRIL